MIIMSAMLLLYPTVLDDQSPARVLNLYTQGVEIQNMSQNKYFKGDPFTPQCILFLMHLLK